MLFAKQLLSHCLRSLQKTSFFDLQQLRLQGRRGAQQEARIVVGQDARPELDQGGLGPSQVVVFKGQVPKAPEVGTWLLLERSATRVIKRLM